MKTIRVFLLGLICILSGSFSPPDQEEYLTYFHRAIACFDKYSYSLAVEYLDKSLALNPKFDTGYYFRAHAQYMRGNYKQAVADCDRVLQINSKYASAYFTKGISIAMTDVISDTLLYQEMIAHKGDQQYLHKFMQRYWLDDGPNPALYDMATSIDVLTKAIALDSTIANAYLWRGYCYHNLKRYHEANKDYTDGLTVDPNSAGLYLNRANTRAEMEGFADDRAERDYDQAIKLEPENGFYYFRRGYYYLTHRFIRIAACADFTKAKELEYNVADSLLNDCHRSFSETDSLFYKGAKLSKRFSPYSSCWCPAMVDMLRKSDTIVPEYKLIITDPSEEFLKDENDGKEQELLP
jgi:tetratricopeptide (TPR) repeat protein